MLTFSILVQDVFLPLTSNPDVSPYLGLIGENLLSFFQETTFNRGDFLDDVIEGVIEILLVRGGCWDCGQLANPPFHNYLCVKCTALGERVDAMTIDKIGEENLDSSYASFFFDVQKQRVSSDRKRELSLPL